MNSAALTLGRAKGSVFLGQALKLTVPVQMEVGEGRASLCFEADVFYGDTRLDAGRVSVSSELLPQTPLANVTIFAQGAVDEPVVTVYLRAGCEAKTTRRYVLLAEVAPAVAVPPPSASALPVVPPVARPLPALRTPQNESRAAAAPRPAKPPRVPPSRGAQLKLEPLDVTQDRDPTLKLSTELVVEEGGDLQRSARADALWRSLNTTPQDILATDSRQQALGADLKSLQGITTKNRQLLEDMTRRLDRAEAGRYANPVVYGLLLSLVVCGLLIAWMWRRAQSGALTRDPWWRDEGLGDKSETVDFPENGAPQADPHAARDVRQAEVPPSTGLNNIPAPPLASVAQVDIPLHGDDPVHVGPSKAVTSSVEKRIASVAQSQPLSRAAGHVDFGHSMSASLLRSVNSKEMLDVRQQAEFFMTLGQHDEAITLLRESVEAGPDANPLVSLELLKVLHTLGRKAEYDYYRSVFNAIFNGHVPVYAEFSQPGSGLEAYPQVCNRIVALWPSEDAVAYIESCLVRTRRESGGQDFDLEAFRDLLMLHGVANRIASSSFDSGFMAFSAAKTAPIPVSVAAEVGVDLDLSEPHNGNLIDFDTSGWSPSEPEGAKGKGR
ncbi:hypothetical protein HZ993_05740 [Rhodoferax sp. AJA081-3]|uniref:type IV pilus assembly protein FimV n=1 Tax=Rhodoferax sp. AJA081-3 TaxID=2752316 RepID=UPI001AE00CB2|nr:hypothetical protein [Rhodoferax sp. AJA081-3]QTN29329.1 hypothetical protein HZ993_05740 [Rhodoferax sp. AJA081-3]